MKKYVFIAFIIIFGTSILSAYMTYNNTNPENEIVDKYNPQNTVQNVDNVSQSTPSDELIISEIEDEIENFISTETQKDIEKTPVAENTFEVKQTKPSNPQVETVQKQPVEEVKQESTENKNINNTPQITKEETVPVQPETPKQEIIKEQPVTIGEEYKINNAMINTIKNIINSNQSEDMKLYGYNIVVDSSIVETTSQFTYTEQRVIDKIKYKFGTIIIYARDYYNNGQYICTQCYII